jgi:3-methylcrotonyl-CoA carboxylase alpha subunit
MTPRLFRKVLVANRGEIACRVLRTCRDLGLRTAAVYSAADADAPHVTLADEAILLGPAPAAESYLRVDRLLDAARRSGADAVHPGYGFLSENADFAQAVRDAGLVFVGPRPETIRAMGSKSGARALMAGHGVPVVPGYTGAQDDAAFIEGAQGIGLPVLIKSSAGGGGKGMSIVRSLDALPAALAAARRMASAAFGDDTLLLEKYVEAPRHVEVQIFGDQHGHAMHLFERECSVQRRFQKVVEESPSPAPQLTTAIRERLCEAGVRAARALGYEGAGTVEFLLDADGAFYFLEVNTRLQVEHPVTELVTGLDLVRLQLLIAMGASLHALVPHVERRGHAIEVRLCAEDPDRDFLPATGTLVEWSPPTGPGVRVDAGVQRGSVIDIHYDSLLAKIIAYGPTRMEALSRLRGALDRLGVQGVTTNRDFLAATLAHPAFLAGDTHTHFIADHLPLGSRRVAPAPGSVERAVIGAALGAALRRHDDAALLPSVRPGWRNSAFRGQVVRYRPVGADTDLGVEYLALRDGGWRVRIDAGPWREAQIRRADDTDHVLTLDGHTTPLALVRHDVEGTRIGVRSSADGTTIVLDERPRFPEAEVAAGTGGCEAPMPGKVVQVLVEVGQTVARGAPLVVLEAMKMEQTLTAPRGGQVSAVRCAAGERVDAGAVLVELVDAPT